MTALAYKFEIDHITVEDYLSGEQISEIKHEYSDGQVYAMAGASIKHNIINANIFALLWMHLNGQSCFPLSSDMLLEISKTKYRYPDVMVICDDDSSNDDYIRKNPLIIVEVLSKSTRKKDKTEKRDEYLSLPSLQEYVLIEQDYAEIDVQRRNNSWQSAYYFLGDKITFESVDVTLSVEDIYQRVDNNDMQDFLKQKEQDAHQQAEQQEQDANEE
ncbi:MAG TPA: Uma2 family endonuclease [Leucothrix mucor]|uniref:Uma2 family endonuclease n=1 Tax=Leucothrix mucor TaxID=45248 RepID=A0A7V2SYI4_LEUMU|nr:Uma2 family endonuclease [Leucothrix mucor]